MLARYMPCLYVRLSIYLSHVADLIELILGRGWGCACPKLLKENLVSPEISIQHSGILCFELADFLLFTALSLMVSRVLSVYQTEHFLCLQHSGCDTSCHVGGDICRIHSASSIVLQLVSNHNVLMKIFSVRHQRHVNYFENHKYRNRHFLCCWLILVVARVWHTSFLNLKQCSRALELFAVRRMVGKKARWFWSLPGCLSVLVLADLSTFGDTIVCHWDMKRLRFELQHSV